MGGTAIGVAADVVSRAAVKSILDAAQNAFGALHGIINNAGIAQTKPFLDITEDDWLRIKQVNSLDVMIGKQEAAPRLIGQSNGGEIVNMASIACKQGFTVPANSVSLDLPGWRKSAWGSPNQRQLHLSGCHGYRDVENDRPRLQGSRPR